MTAHHTATGLHNCIPAEAIIAQTSHAVKPMRNTHGKGYDRLSPSAQPMIASDRSISFVKDSFAVLGLFPR
jgi:hypothetical protein